MDTWLFFSVASLKINFFSWKLIPSDKSDNGGKITFFTSTLITALKEAPIMIPIAISIILPFTAKSLNSFISFMLFCFIS